MALEASKVGFRAFEAWNLRGWDLSGSKLKSNNSHVRKSTKCPRSVRLSCTRLRVPPATRVAADFLDFIAFCRCSTGVALQPLKILVSRLPPPVPGGVAPKFGSDKVSRYTGVSQLQLRVSRYTVQLSRQDCALVW